MNSLARYLYTQYHPVLLRLHLVHQSAFRGQNGDRLRTSTSRSHQAIKASAEPVTGAIPHFEA